MTTLQQKDICVCNIRMKRRRVARISLLIFHVLPYPGEVMNEWDG